MTTLSQRFVALLTTFNRRFNPMAHTPTNIKFQHLPNVCNGGEIHSLADSGAVSLGTTSPLDNSTEADICRALEYETKAIMVVEDDQKKISALLYSWTPKGGDKSVELKATKLCRWSPSSCLWMVRRKIDTTKEEDE